jgi:hypothetical protein
MDNTSRAGRFIFVDGSFNGSGPLNFVDSSLAKDQFLITSGSPSFSGNVSVGNGSLNSGMLQYRSANPDPFGTGTIQVNGGILTADNGTTTPTTLGNSLIQRRDQRREHSGIERLNGCLRNSCQRELLLWRNHGERWDPRC